MVIFFKYFFQIFFFLNAFFFTTHKTQVIKVFQWVPGFYHYLCVKHVTQDTGQVTHVS